MKIYLLETIIRHLIHGIIEECNIKTNNRELESATKFSLS